MNKVIEDEFEREVILPIFGELGYEVLYGPDIAPDGDNPERESYEQVILTRRLDKALRRINPGVSPSVIEDAIRQLLRVESPDLLTNNHLFHKRLKKGVQVEVHTPEGELTTLDVLLVDETGLIIMNGWSSTSLQWWRRDERVGQMLLYFLTASPSPLLN